MTAHPFLDRIRAADLVEHVGRVRRVMPTYVEADGPAAPLGTLCEIERAGGAAAAAEIVGVHPGAVVLAPLDGAAGVLAGARVIARPALTPPVGDALLGRAVDALGRPLDGLGSILAGEGASFRAAAAPLDRVTPSQVLETGVRAIDGLLTLGRGQRIGVFAPAGVGKTSLTTQIARQADADRCVVCLVGERGREVEALWSKGLSKEAKARTVLVAATSDETAAMRVRAGEYALRLAEHWRAQGLHVLLLLDSVTRLAMALREIGLAAGEPPTVRAYTPGVFAALPKLVERCGAVRGGGAISAIMTVLSESEEIDDPISETMKSILDGHVLLSRSLAEQGRFPAVDVPRSISRLAAGLTDAPHKAAAVRAVEALSTYEASRTMIEAGIYVRGASPEIDRAIDRRPGLIGFLRQSADECMPFAATREALLRAAGG